MNAPSRDNNRTLMLTLLAGMTIVILLLAGFLSIVGAQTELDEPPVPLRMVKANDQPQTVTEPVDVNNLGPKWRPVFTEGFESANWRDNWLFNIELSKPPLGYIWGVRQISDNPSEHAAWAVGGGDNGGNLELINPSYPAGVDSWLVAGPFDFTNAEDALVTLDLFYEANQGDPFSVGISEELISGDFVEQQPVINKDVNQNEGSWEQLQWSLSAYIGKPTIYIAFTFSSAAGDIEKLGALMDNVQVWVEGEPGTYLPMISYDLVPTSVPPTVEPPPGGGDYRHDFTDNIDPWQARRWTNGTSYTLSHLTGADDNHDGFLNLLVNTSGSHYVIASPLVAGPTPPYNIETTVKLRSTREDGDQYGVVFGGNYNGGDCPATDFSTCFTQYYELRVYFWHDDPANKDRMKIKLKRIDSHDADNNNEGPDLIDWTGQVSDIDEQGFIEWDITVEADGKIKISANDLPVASTTDSTYINNPYFGVIVRTEDHADSEAKFDYFDIKSID